MSNEVFQMIKKFDLDSTDVQLILQCAPVLTGLKPANLLNIKSTQGREVCRILYNKKISVYTLYDNGAKMCLLLYRNDELWEYLNESRVKSMFNDMGYDISGMRQMLKKFSEKYKKYLCGEGDFPHEMGLFLGYPVDDVEGFIENKGKNFLCSGYWKVYKDMPEKKKLFKKFEKAEEILIKRLYSGGLKNGINKGDILVTVR